MNRINTEKITWKYYKPTTFPCRICHENEATIRATYQHKETIISLCLCESCHNTPDAYLEEAIFKRNTKEQAESPVQ